MNNHRIFMGVYPTGIVYADRHREVQRDYARLAFLPFGTLEPEFAPDCPPELRPQIEADMATIQARRGEEYRTSTCGQTVLLGKTRAKYLLEYQPSSRRRWYLHPISERGAVEHLPSLEAEAQALIEREMARWPGVRVRITNAGTGRVVYQGNRAGKSLAP